jgi:hypothetical protein
LGRAKKEALIRGDFDALQVLSARRTRYEKKVRDNGEMI